MRRGRRGRGRARNQETQGESSGTAEPAAHEAGLLTQLINLLGGRRGQGRRDEGPSHLIKTAKEMGATEFGGSVDPAVNMSWFKSINRVLTQAMECTDADKLRVVGYMLVDDAQVWWDEIKETIETWDQFREAFKANFCPQAFLDRKRVEFERLKQGDMTVSEYEAKFRELCEYAPYMVPNEQTKKKKFLEGLREEFNVPLSMIPYTSFIACRDGALEAERMTQLNLESSGKQKKRHVGSEYGSSSQGSSKRGSHSSGSSGGSSNFYTTRRNWQSLRGSIFQRGSQAQSSSFMGGRGRYHSGACRDGPGCFHCG